MNGTNGNEPGYPENALVPYPVIVAATTFAPLSPATRDASRFEDRTQALGPHEIVPADAHEPKPEIPYGILPLSLSFQNFGIILPVLQLAVEFDDDGAVVSKPPTLEKAPEPAIASIEALLYGFRGPKPVDATKMPPIRRVENVDLQIRNFEAKFGATGDQQRLSRRFDLVGKVQPCLQRAAHSAFSSIGEAELREGEPQKLGFRRNESGHARSAVVSKEFRFFHVEHADIERRAAARFPAPGGCRLPYERFGRTLVNIPACHKTALRFRGRTTQQIIRSQKRIRQRRGRGALEKRLRYRVRWRLKRSLVKSAAVLLALSVASSAAEMQRRSAEDRRALKSGCGDPPRSKLRMRRKKRLGTSPVSSRDIERRVLLRVHVRAAEQAHETMLFRLLSKSLPAHARIRMRDDTGHVASSHSSETNHAADARF